MAPCVLTIAGSDSGAGAGLQADLRTFQALGVFGLTAVTAVTAQNSRKVAAWKAVSPDLLVAQIALALATPVAAVKTGLLPSLRSVRAASEALARSAIPLVVDPVIASTSGTRFLTKAGIRALRSDLLPLATLVTPNWPEAEALSGLPVRSYAQAEAAALKLTTLGCAVLLKGGHGSGRTCRDYFATENEAFWLEATRISTPNTRGTGCVLSSAITAFLARGMGLTESVMGARAFLLEALASGGKKRWNGAGPAFDGEGAGVPV